MKITISDTIFSDDFYRLFGTSKEDVLTIIMNDGPTRIIFGNANIFIYKLIINCGKISFYFLDCGGTLLKFENGRIFPYDNTEIENYLKKLFQEYWNKTF